MTRHMLNGKVISFVKYLPLTALAAKCMNFRTQTKALGTQGMQCREALKGKKRRFVVKSELGCSFVCVWLELSV